jgi:hypothetical protein
MQEADTTAVDGVLIRIYTSPGDVFVTQGTSGDGVNPTGDRLFNLTAGAYTMRFSMSTSGYSFTNGSPQALTVTGVPAADIFDIEVDLHSRPVATDSNLCRCSGFFRDADGSLLVGGTLWFVRTTQPHLLLLDALLGERIRVVTDADGYAQVDLVRDAVYRLEHSALIDVNLEMRVPVASSANLPDVIFPIVSYISPTTSPVALAAGAAASIQDVSIVYRSGLSVVLSEFVDGVYPVEFESDDPAVAGVGVVDGQVAITAIAAGTANITATRVIEDEDTAIAAVPAAGAVTGSIVVNVT